MTQEKIDRINELARKAKPPEGLTDEELKDAYEKGEILYVGNIPLSLREYYADEAKVSDALSTHIYYLSVSVGQSLGMA